MSVHRHELKVAIAALILIGYALALSMLTQVMSSVQTSKSISNTGSLKAVGVGVYWDAALTNRVSSISWGVLEPGSNASKTVYIRNEGNFPVTLTMTVSNWNPANASSYMTLKWDYSGKTLDVSEVIQVKFTLSVSPAVAGITNFSFDITIIANG